MKNFEHAVCTWPRLTICHRCNRQVLDGLDAGMAYRVDVIPLTLEGEVCARLNDQRTYRIASRHVFLRELPDIHATSDGNRPPVVAEHICAPIDTRHISQADTPDVIALIKDRYLDKATPEQNREQVALLTIAGQFDLCVTDSPDDQDPPF